MLSQIKNQLPSKEEEGDTDIAWFYTKLEKI